MNLIFLNIVEAKMSEVRTRLLSSGESLEPVQQVLDKMNPVDEQLDPSFFKVFFQIFLKFFSQYFLN